MKRIWLYAGVAGASIVQFSVERFWNSTVSADSFRDLHAVLKDAPHLLSIFFSQLAFAIVIGFFYLHVPHQKRSVKSGITIGAILGLLTGLSQFLSWYAMFDIPFPLVVREATRMTLLGVAGGGIISFVELKMNTRHPPTGA